ncbi:MAG: sensor histidine kinase [Acidimicrobiales bacterium]
MKRLSLRVRLAIACSTAMAVLVLVIGAVLFFQLRSELQSSTDRSLRVQADSLISGVLSGNASFGDTTFPGIVAGLPFSELVRANGQVVESSEPLGQRSFFGRSTLEALRHPKYLTVSVRGVHGPARLLAIPVTVGGARLVVVTGRSLTRENQVLSSFTGVLTAGSLLAVFAAAVAGWLLAAAALRPVERMRREAAEITASDQDRRLPVPANNDEISRLSVTLNEMLDRLHASFRHEQRFVDDASHELRTPLTLLKAELELGLSRSRSATELDGVVRRSLLATNDLINLAQDLLVLARADGGRIPLGRQDVRLDVAVEAVVADFAQRAESAGVGLEVSATQQRASLDETRVRQALTNMIDNALAHTPRGGQVEVEAEEIDGSVRVTVRDTGTGFAPEVLDTAFEPFVRGPASRVASSPGAGLGLTIVRSIAESHGGTACLENRKEGGATVTIRLPTR